MEKAVCTLGSITLQDQKIKSNNYHFLCVGRLINILVFITVSTSYLDPKIQYHENRTFLFCLSIYTHAYMFEDALLLNAAHIHIK